MEPHPQSRLIVSEHDNAAMSSHNRAHQAQPETIAGGSAAWFEADKTVQDRLSIRLRNAWPAVPHFENGLPVVAEYADLDLAAACIFEGIV